MFIKILQEKFKKYWALLKKEYFSQFFAVILLNALLIIGQFTYLLLRYKYLNSSVPFWYSMPWGDYQLDYKRNLFIIPALSFLISVVGAFMATFMRRYFVRYLSQVIAAIITFANIAFTYSLVRIITIASVPYPSLINPLYLQLFPPFIAGFFIVYFFAPKFINFAKEHGIVTNPQVHEHPGMILTKSSARGGGVVFALGFMLVSFFFVPMSKELSGIFLVVFLIALLGLADDYQNTHPKSFLHFLESPFLRLPLLFAIVAPIVFFGIKISFIVNPFGGIFQLTAITYLSFIVTIFWIVWILNLLSWSNGVDGQYSGIIGVSSLVIALLALRFVPLLPKDLGFARLAVIAAGCSFGLVKYTWYPSKIMWGFSAMAAGAVLATLSILVNAKVATSIIMILIPFLDAVVTAGRRILQKKNPLKGDRGHLHHLLLERGWSVQKIALFYWVSTALFGVIGLMSSEQNTVLVALTLAGIVAFFIILLNLRSMLKKQVSSVTAK